MRRGTGASHGSSCTNSAGGGRRPLEVLAYFPERAGPRALEAQWPTANVAIAADGTMRNGSSEGMSGRVIPRCRTRSSRAPRPAPRDGARVADTGARSARSLSVGSRAGAQARPAPAVPSHAGPTGAGVRLCGRPAVRGQGRARQPPDERQRARSEARRGLLRPWATCPGPIRWTDQGPRGGTAATSAWWPTSPPRSRTSPVIGSTPRT